MSAAVLPTMPVGVPSGVAADIIGRPYHVLYELIRAGKIEPPPLVAGRFIWREQDIEAARQALAIDRRRKADRQAVQAAAPATC